jgi:hypothetical protein
MRGSCMVLVEQTGKDQDWWWFYKLGRAADSWSIQEITDIEKQPLVVIVEGSSLATSEINKSYLTNVKITSYDSSASRVG